MIKRAYIDLEACNQSEDCSARQHCSKEAIKFEDGKIYVNQLCTGCGKCKRHCDNKAIRLI
ncbi:4Fe-4S binding protein [Fuchsiella alkaliacetigena]|uniref:4Fe-4S binding protein n=1 Tax=Fuchsiella alkaliacetigena TaxID=957042 RepID=UPI00200B6480|nr:4Fe-4S binding protein [Fuchsiella alkaliacetigena]MCK8825815.1 4Fe-4S binding protein [Fuchsiella alkaliacetigena]